MEKTYNHNFLQNNNFQFSLDRIPNTTFRVIACDIPSITIAPAQAGYPGASQYFPGNTTEFEELTLDFLVDENLDNYEELYNWITQQRYCSDFVPTNDIDRKMVSDGNLVTLTNSSNPNRVFHFKAMFPVSLGNIHFDTTIDRPESIRCQVTFKYSYFVMNKKAYQ